MGEAAVRKRPWPLPQSQQETGLCGPGSSAAPLAEAATEAAVWAGAKPLHRVQPAVPQPLTAWPGPRSHPPVGGASAKKQGLRA